MGRGVWVLLIGIGVAFIGVITFDFTIMLLGGLGAVVGIVMIVVGGAKAGVKAATGDKTGSGRL